MTLFLAGLAFLSTGLLFLVAPESLRDSGFGQDVAFGYRVLGLLVFGGAAAAFAWPAWWLMRLRSSALEIARSLALGLTVTFAIQIWRGDGSVREWLTVVVAGAMAGYLTLSRVRVLFRPPRD